MESIPGADSDESDSENNSMASFVENKKSGNYIRVLLPSNQSSVINLSSSMTIKTVLTKTCKKRQLDPRDHFISLGVETGTAEERKTGKYPVCFLKTNIFINLRQNR